VADVLYVAAAYWPYLAAVFALGIGVGWWVEARRDDFSDWPQSDRDASS
jgi:hypothetical protein